MPYSSSHMGIGTQVHDLSEMMSSGLDIFHRPDKDSSIKSGKTIDHQMITALQDGNTVIEFVIPSEGHDYTFLPLTRLDGVIEIRKANGDAVADADLVAPVNLISSALFRQIECEVNGVQVADLTSPAYPYKAFIESHLTYGYDAKNSHLKAALYHQDTVGKEEQYLATCESFSVRQGWVTKHANKLYFSTPLFIDFFACERFLIPGVTIKLKFLKSEDRFCLLSATDTWKVNIKALSIQTRKLTIHEDIVAKHKDMILKEPAIYPIDQSKIKTFVLTQGISSQTVSSVFRGKLPRFAIIGLVESASYNGAFNKNPFKFTHFNLSYLAFNVNGTPYPSRVFQPDFANGNFMREYRHFMDHIGISHENETNYITPESYAANTCFFPFDLSPDLCNGYHNHVDNSGFVNIELQFREALTTNVNLVVYATYSEEILIDHQGQVTLKA